MAFTVSAAMPGFTFSLGFRLLVLTGATEAGGSNVAAVLNGSLTPAGANSYIAFGLYNESNSTAFAASANNTLLDNVVGAVSTGIGSGSYTGAVAAGTPVTVGAASPTGLVTSLAGYEVRAAGGSTPVRDGSGPPFINGSSSPATTASFTPPAGAVLAALVMGDSTTQAVPAISDTSGMSLTWTQRARFLNGVDAQTTIFTTTIPAGGGGGRRPQKIRTVYGNPAHLVGSHQASQLTNAAFR